MTDTGNILYLYNTESSEIGIAIGEKEAVDRFLSKRSGWIFIDKDIYYMIRDAVDSAIYHLKDKIRSL